MANTTDTTFADIASVNNLVYGALMNYPAVNDVKIDDEKFEYGVPERISTVKSGNEVNKSFAESIGDRLWFPEISFRDSDSIQKEEVSEELRFGAQLHLVLENLAQNDNLDRTIDKLYNQDRIEKKFKQRIQEKAQQIVEFPAYQTLIDDADKVYDEQDIIASEIGVLRPDKLFVKGNTCTVLDYKTGKERKEHLQQMQKYLFVLKEMGYSQVNGILFYTEELKMMEVY
jgi:ATP-dependent exoDNAse (exonuclease V) beta subunit